MLKVEGLKRLGLGLARSRSRLVAKIRRLGLISVSRNCRNVSVSSQSHKLRSRLHPCPLKMHYWPRKRDGSAQRGRSMLCYLQLPWLFLVSSLLCPQQRLQSIVMSASVCVSVCPRAYIRNHTRDRHGDYTPHRLSAEGGDGSAQRGRSVIYDCLVILFFVWFCMAA